MTQGVQAGHPVLAERHELVRSLALPLDGAVMFAKLRLGGRCVAYFKRYPHESYKSNLDPAAPGVCVTIPIDPQDPLSPLRAALAGRYEIEREIGQGAFATVYLARDWRHERRVALKVLNADPASEAGELRFIREIRLLARLQHPNILPLLDSGHIEALLYYLMPYVSGETLRARMTRERQLSIEAAVRIARESADALAYAHTEGIIHRDIKPENILLSGGHAIVADFGIARAIDLGGVRQLTRTGMGGPGTPAYMSPEQLMGDRQLDGRSDVYSLGCVLYEMLTGKPPFAGKEGFVKRFTESGPRPSGIRKDLPEWLDEVVARTLAREPSDRYRVAEDLVRALSGPTAVEPATRVTGVKEHDLNDSLESQLRQTLAGTHTVERELSVGGNSRLFLGCELRFRRQVVIKVLPPEFAAVVSAEAFEREIAVAANLQHANIVPILTAGQTAGLPFFTMPFVDGESLRARLQRGQIPPSETLSILTDIARALACAHSHGIVHGDIKPEKILLSGGAATVTDFGVAKALAASKHRSPTTLTGVGPTLGTPGYMSPEQATGGEVAARSDLYSWGVVAYEMISGRHPFAHRKSGSQAIAHVSARLVPLTSATGSSLPLRKAVMQCLAKEPNTRPPSADSLLLQIRPRLSWAAGAGALAAGILLAIGLLAGVAFAFVPREKLATVIALARRRPALLHNDRVIVAPFSNETGEQHLAPLGSMAADWIAQGLARTGTLHVVDARTVAITSEVVSHIPWPWRGRDSGKALAQETGAGILISGRFYRDADTLRFQANGVDVNDGKLLWSLSPVSGLMSSPTTVLENLRRRIVALVTQTSDTTSFALSTLSEPPSLEAYTEFRRGLEGIFAHSASAYSHLFRATSLDTTYVTPWVLLAVAAEDRGDKAVMDSALKRVNRLAEHMTPVERAIIEYTKAKTQGDLEGTLGAAQTVFQLTPGSSESPLMLATAALAVRRPHTALAALREVDPDRGLNLAAPYFWKNRTVASYQLADYRGAADACSRGRRRFPKDYFLAYFCVSSFLHLGQVDKVADLLAKDELGAGGTELAVRAAQVMADVGLTAESRELAMKWLKHLSNGSEFDYSRALLLMAAGRWVEGKSMLTKLAETDSGPRGLRVLGALGVVNARLQLPAEALRIDSLLASSRTVLEGGEREILRARIHAQLGDLEAGVALADAGRDKGWELLSLMNSLADDHWLVPLRPLRSFQAIVALKD